ncbi:MAG: hypothetical protein Q8O22_04810 [Candidatus Omnitrophota bacterium]|nr:hypothetical protein [Candidatus Omnitrophota bacterium]
MKIYSYVVKHDTGFAPNAFWGYCTLACCKPKIRKLATVGDWVVGTGSVENIGNDKLIYAMKITEKLSFEQYSRDKRFQNKIPAKGLMEERGDNIFYKGENSGYILRKSLHNTEEQKRTDLSADSVLVADWYFYFGKNGCLIPAEFRAVIKKGPAHKCNFDQNFSSRFIKWLEENFQRGLQGEPFDYKEKLFVSDYEKIAVNTSC